MTFNCSYKGSQGDIIVATRTGRLTIIVARTGRVKFNCSYKDRKGDI